MAGRLKSDERKLLDALIRSPEAAWWEVVPLKDRRNRALKALIKLQLIEVHPTKHLTKPTARGRDSNRKARDVGLVVSW